MARTARQRAAQPPVSPTPPNQSPPPSSAHVAKEHERIIKDAHNRAKKLESYLADDENFPSFALHLAKKGLELRDIPGDGNCLFRALGDQIEGHGRNHYKHRGQVVDYMFEHRVDFEPFVESDIPFTQYLHQLQRLGTYAGNDAIMAFARVHSVNVVIHQLSAPLLMIHGSESTNPRQIHLAYHNGDHYSSVRRINDNTETPTSIHIQVNSETCPLPTPTHSKSQTEANLVLEDHVMMLSGCEVEVAKCHVPFTNPHPLQKPEANLVLEDHVMMLSGCEDREMVRQSLADNHLDPDEAIAEILQHMEMLSLGDGSSISQSNDSGIWSDSGTGTRIFGSGSTDKTVGGARPKHQSKKERKQEKKQLSVDRHRKSIQAQTLQL